MRGTVRAVARRSTSRSCRSSVPLEQASDFALECAGHARSSITCVPLLKRGTHCVVASIGALSDAGLLDAALERRRRRRAHAAAALRRDRRHRRAGRGAASAASTTCATPAASRRTAGTARRPNRCCDLRIADATRRVIFEGSAREAARLYPKNANVAATDRRSPASAWTARSCA